MAWNLTTDRPIYLQLMEQIQLSILSGIYKPGTRLPSVRDLSTEASVNPNTMQKALSELERTGLIFSMRTSGRFITEDSNMIEDLKKNYVRTQVLAFYHSLKELGFTKEEIIHYMNIIDKEEGLE
ncbi:MAG: GntR family transcriptional regulator [Lachnospiraceae bacterium]|nr:GntR family transcriptional regulator [Lachnospiraceae bacterium]